MAVPPEELDKRLEEERERYSGRTNQYAKDLTRSLRRLKESDIDDKDKVAILELLEWKRADGAAISSLHQYIGNLLKTAERADTPLLDMTEEELRDLFVSFANGTHPDVKDEGINLQTYQIALRNFVKIHDTDYSDLPQRHEDHYERHPLSITDVPGRDIEPDDLLYQNEIDDLLEACGMDVRYKSFIALALASGQRIDALRTLRVGDVEWNGKTGDIKLNTEEGSLKGKTGKVPLLWAKHYIQDWLKSHPFKNDEDFDNKYLFCADPRMKGADGSRDGTQPLDASTIRKRLKVLADRADLDKRIYPHLLRHTAISRMVVEGLSEQQVKAIVGWDPDSSEFGTYAHIAEELSNDSIRKALGLPTSEETTRPLLGMPTLLECPECDDKVPEGVKRCQTCNAPLTDAEYVENQAGEETSEDLIDHKMRKSYKQAENMDQVEKVQAVDEILDQAEENPELKAALLEKLAE